MTEKEIKLMNRKVTLEEVIRKTYTVEQVSPEDGVVFDFTKFMQTSKNYNIGWNLKHGTHCKKCKKPFKDGDKMYMAITDKGNIFLCKDCARELRRQLGKPDYCKPENQHLNNQYYVLDRIR